ncbi:MAG: hypothetical protein R3Y27_02975 [Clostridia bacterium]
MKLRILGVIFTGVWLLENIIAQIVFLFASDGFFSAYSTLILLLIVAIVFAFLLMEFISFRNSKLEDDNPEKKHSASFFQNKFYSVIVKILDVIIIVYTCLANIFIIGALMLEAIV